MECLWGSVLGDYCEYVPPVFNGNLPQAFHDWTAPVFRILADEFCNDHATEPCFETSDCPGGETCQKGTGTGTMANAPQLRPNTCSDDAFICGLSEEELTVAVLHHLDGYTQDGIAESLDLSRRTVGKILQRFEEHVKKRAARSGFTDAGSVSNG